MSDPKEKEKTKKFVLPSSLKNVQQQIRSQIQSFSQDPKEPIERTKKQQKKRHSLFKLNPASAIPVTESIDVIRKRSKSQRLESLEADPSKEVFSLMDHLKEKQEKQIFQKKHAPKNYPSLNLLAAITGENKEASNNIEQEQQPEKYEIVRPSQPYHIRSFAEKQEGDGIFQPTIFQTPILPCFSSEIKRAPELTKTIQEGEGLWKIGRIKVKGKRCQLRIGEQFLFEGEKVPSEGKAGLISGAFLHNLPNWKDIWILQPHESLFID